MKKPPDNPEFAKFTEAMRHIMGVSKATIREREEAEKKERESGLNPFPPSLSPHPLCHVLRMASPAPLRPYP